MKIDLKKYFLEEFPTSVCDYMVAKHAIYIYMNEDCVSFLAVKKLSEFFNSEEIDISLNSITELYDVQIYNIDGSKYQ